MIKDIFDRSKYGKLYLKIIKKYNNMNGKTEAHHILPVSIYPEFADFKMNPWNKANVSPRIHFILHILLFKHYKKVEKYSNSYISMINAINFMSNCGKYNSKYYNKFKIHLKRSEVHKSKISKKLTQVYSIYNSKNEEVYSTNGVSFDRFCEELKLPKSQLKKSYQEKGRPIYLDIKGSNNVNNETKKFYKNWYCLKNNEKRDERFSNSDYLELLEYGTNKMVKIFDNENNEIYNIKEYLLLNLLINEGMPMSLSKVGKKAYDSNNGLYKCKKDGKEKYYMWRTEYV